MYTSRVTTRLNRGAPLCQSSVSPLFSASRSSASSWHFCRRRQTSFSLLHQDAFPRSGRWAVQQRAGRCHPQITFADNVLICAYFSLRSARQTLRPLIRPQTATSQKAGACAVQQRHLYMYEVNMQTLNRQRSNRVEICVTPSK